MKFRKILASKLLLIFLLMFIYINGHADVKSLVQQQSVRLNAISHVNPQALNTALTMYYCSTDKGLNHTPYLTLIDYSLPSNEKRLWLFDMKNNKLLLNTWVAHGMKSGEVYPNSFSNKHETHKSSIGFFQVGKSYTGEGGYSARLMGLSPGFNDNAYKRNLVVHGAWYVSEDFVKKYGRVGRTWGCPAVPTSLTTKVVNIIRNGSVLIVYYPDKKWLSNSTYLACQ